MSCAQSFLPRLFRVGPLILDLLHRDAQFQKHWLALYPREFELLWRLGEGRGNRVCRATLLRDVWRLSHVPETNSLEVHVHRLRAKLRGHGLAGLILTDDEGGYRIDESLQAGRSAFGPTLPDAPAKVHAGNSALDSHVMLRKAETHSDEGQHDFPDQRARFDPAER